MIASWMLHTLAVSALLCVGALAAERVLRFWRSQARAVWIVAMVLSILLPAIALAQAIGWIPAFSRVAPEPLSRSLVLILPPVEVRGSMPAREIGLAVVWGIASVALAIRLIVAARTLGRRRCGWRSEVLDGQPLLVSPDAGPAVVGFRRPAVVIPEWVVTLDAGLRALVLRHEREHLDRGDPRLLLGAVALAVATPWNVAMWFQLYRLRSAMELDCDARVLRAYPNARRYGSLLLAVAQRADRGGLLTAALTESNSLLARRIKAMRFAVPRHRVVQSLVLVALAGTATIVACGMRAPTEPKPSAALAPPPPPRPIMADANTVFFEFQVEEPVTPAAGSQQPRYPDDLRRAGITGEVLAQFVVEPDGRADVASLKVLNQPREEFVRSIRNALPQMRFNPRAGGRESGPAAGAAAFHVLDFALIA